MVDSGSGVNGTENTNGSRAASTGKRIGDVPHPATPLEPTDPESPPETPSEGTSSSNILHNVLHSNNKGKSGQTVDEHRTAFVNDVPNNPFGDNTISTSKYTMWSFVPRSLFEQ